jgi:Flp pilus assembly protein TadG
MTVMLGMLGLAFDLGRMFIVKNELQTFADASALAACRQMDGTKTGIQRAHNTATAGPIGSSKPNGWNFDVNTISTITDTYSTTFAGTYDSYATASSNATNSYRFINVSASASLPLYFLSVIPGLPTSQPLQASSTAGQQEQTATFSSGGLVPVAPAAHNAADTKNFGLTPNTEYTLKWGNGDSTTCAGDLGFNPADSPSSHGFIDLGQGNGNSSLRSVIVYGGYPNSSSSPNHVSAGDQLGAVPGNRGASIFSSFAERSNQDPDQTSLTWEQYKAAGTGNGRRIITAPIYDPAQSGGHGANAHITVIGFANFLLDPGAIISGSSGPFCATYIGPASQTGGSSGGSDGTKVYNVMLFQ